jgi:hypothetical protein
MTAFNDNNITDAGRCDINLYTPKPVPFQTDTIHTDSKLYYTHTKNQA